MSRIPAFVLAAILALSGLVLVHLVIHANAAAGYPDAILSYPAAPPTPTIGQPPAAAAPALSSVAISPLAPSDLLAGWQVVDTPSQLPGEGGRWEVRDGYLYQDGLNPAGSLSAATTELMSPAAYGDVTVSMAFYDAANGNVGLIARHSAAGFYRVRLQTDPSYDGEALVVEKVTAGIAVPLVLNTSEPLYQRHTWHTLTLSVRGNQITVTLDGRIVAAVEDAAPLPAGTVGIATRALGGIFFDRITLAGEAE
jgi:hypothetical protein